MLDDPIHDSVDDALRDRALKAVAIADEYCGSETVTALLKLASVEAVSALLALADVNAEDPVAVRKLQNTVQRYRDMQEWIRNFIETGDAARVLNTRQCPKFLVESVPEAGDAVGVRTRTQQISV